MEFVNVDYLGHVIEVWVMPSSPAADAAITQVARLARLQRLLVHTSVSDAEMAHREGLTNLSRLCLRGTQVTDAVLAHP